MRDRIIHDIERDLRAAVDVQREVTEGAELDVGTRLCPELHRHVVVHENELLVTCQCCGARLSAHAVLLEYARRERRFRWAEENRQEQRKTIEELKREERNLRARIKRLQDKVGA